jgi:hypothetical protein
MAPARMCSSGRELPHCVQPVPTTGRTRCVCRRGYPATTSWAISAPKRPAMRSDSAVTNPWSARKGARRGACQPAHAWRPLPARSAGLIPPVRRSRPNCTMDGRTVGRLRLSPRPRPQAGRRVPSHALGRASSSNGASSAAILTVGSRRFTAIQPVGRSLSPAVVEIVHTRGLVTSSD